MSQVRWPTWCTPNLQGNSDCVTVIRAIPRPREVCPWTSLLLKQTRPAHCQENSLTRISWYYTSGTADRREPCVCQPPCYYQQTRWKPSDRLPAQSCIEGIPGTERPLGIHSEYVKEYEDASEKYRKSGWGEEQSKLLRLILFGCLDISERRACTGTGTGGTQIAYPRALKYTMYASSPRCVFQRIGACIFQMN